MHCLLLAISLVLLPGAKQHSRAYGSLIEDTAQHYCVDANLMAAQMWQESHADRLAIGYIGEVGLFQIIPSDNDLGPSFSWRPEKMWLLEPKNNIDYAGRMLRQLYRRTNSWRESLALFNCGEIRLYANACGKGGGWQYADTILNMRRKWYLDYEPEPSVGKR